MKRRFPEGTFAWLPLAAASAGNALLFVLILSMDGGFAALLMVFHQYILAPLLSFLLPAFSTYRGAEPYAAFFPPFICLWLLPPLFSVRSLPLTILMSFLLGVVGACAGNELRKRRK